jgi:hypothetical protein
VQEKLKVVAHYLDGTLVKGTTQDFVPMRPIFHLRPMDGGELIEVRCDRLKAVFFVKDYVGSASRRDVKGFIEGPKVTLHGRKVAVRFKDGELFCGYTLAFSFGRSGFFVFPVDAESNNLRAYVLTDATKEIKTGPPAEILARKALEGSKAA